MRYRTTPHGRPCRDTNHRVGTHRTPGKASPQSSVGRENPARIFLGLEQDEPADFVARCDGGPGPRLTGRRRPPESWPRPASGQPIAPHGRRGPGCPLRASPQGPRGGEDLGAWDGEVRTLPPALQASQPFDRLWWTRDRKSKRRRKRPPRVQRPLRAGLRAPRPRSLREAGPGPPWPRTGLGGAGCGRGVGEAKGQRSRAAGERRRGCGGLHVPFASAGPERCPAMVDRLPASIL